MYLTKSKNPTHNNSTHNSKLKKNFTFPLSYSTKTYEAAYYGNHFLAGCLTCFPSNIALPFYVSPSRNECSRLGLSKARTKVVKFCLRSGYQRAEAFDVGKQRSEYLIYDQKKNVEVYIYISDYEGSYYFFLF